MIDNAGLLEQLDKATHRAATFAIRRGFPVPLSKNSSLVGNAFVEKNSKGLYDVLGIDKSIIYEDISVFDVAVIIAQRYCSGELSSIKQILYLEHKFAKHHTDMLHYLHCMKAAKKNNDTERLAILEDKFQTAEAMAKDTRDRLSTFKRTK